MVLSERIRAAMAAKGISQAELARAVGVKPPSIHGWLNGKARFLRGENLLKAAEALGVRQEWLANGTGEMTQGEQNYTDLRKFTERADPELANLFEQMDGELPQAAAPSPAPVQHIPGAKQVVLVEDDSPDLYRIPKVTLRLQAGVTGFQTEPDRRDGGTMGLSRNWVERKGLDPAKLLSMGVRGESMEPTIYEGDTVVINLADTKPVDNGVYAVNYDGEAVIKRLSRDMGKWWLMSDNPDQRKFYRRVCQGAECLIIGRVVRREGDHF